MDVGRLVARSMRKYRDRVALEGPEGESTYGRTGARVMQLARGLRGLGLETAETARQEVAIKDPLRRLAKERGESRTIIEFAARSD